jgi:glycerol-1-phosphate dehydrogenase [NAD(P)+]
VVHGRSAAAAVLHELSYSPGTTYLLVHAGSASGTGYGAALAADGRRLGLEIAECVVDANTEVSVDVVEARIGASRPDFVIGVGGGRMVDVAKLAAAHQGVDFISLPTQASSDGICSPVAVIKDADGRPRSLGARIPVGIVVDMEVLSSARPDIWRSGLGDLVSNLSAVRDWRLAYSTQGQEIDDFACLTSEAAALSVVGADANLADPVFREKLIRGLILSGIAMEMAGSSRPASGSEHLISHALDRMLPRPRLHGLQVALGTIAAYLLRGDDLGELVAFFRATGLPMVPADLGLAIDEVLEAIRQGTSTRPARWTVLDQIGEADLDKLRAVYETDGLGAWR